MFYFFLFFGDFLCCFYQSCSLMKVAIRSIFSGRIPGKVMVYSPSSISLSMMDERMERISILSQKLLPVFVNVPPK